ncbi:hypothetical protein [Streptomyces sp. NBC_01013]|uniref:hypothetical protein n=1 Tax=Streptomyces sp. NBC_01013 TaxID=2903718 RepID=UPI00386CF2A1|nr:hypothetical protein OG538_32250 [Streptomyces sp. NBC_01013]
MPLIELVVCGRGAVLGSPAADVLLRLDAPPPRPRRLRIGIPGTSAPGPGPPYDSMFECG